MYSHESAARERRSDVIARVMARAPGATTSPNASRDPSARAVASDGSTHGTTCTPSAHRDGVVVAAVVVEASIACGVARDSSRRFEFGAPTRALGH
jgi:hypothetical protein